MSAEFCVQEGALHSALTGSGGSIQSPQRMLPWLKVCPYRRRLLQGANAGR